MRRRYTIHRDGDLLVEELAEDGVAVDPEPTPESERLPFEVLVRSPDGSLARQRLVELLEAVLNLEAETSDWQPHAAQAKGKLPIV